MEEIVGKPRALIVDDEAPARLRLRELLERSPSVVLSGECASGAEALAAIRDLQPELLLLDVQMPVMDGFQVLRRIPNDRMPVTIFVTAYDRYALAAFEAHALDYLLKPFSDERFAKALDRALSQIEMRQSGEIASRMLAMLNSGIGRTALRARRAAAAGWRSRSTAAC
jgi:two-component system LytT family response regulator